MRRRASRRLYRYLVDNGRAPLAPACGAGLARQRAARPGGHAAGGGLSRRQARFRGLRRQPGERRTRTVRTMHRFDVRRDGRLITYSRRRPTPSCLTRCVGPSARWYRWAGGDRRTRSNHCCATSRYGRPDGAAAGALPSAGHLPGFGPQRRDRCNRRTCREGLKVSTR